MSPGPLSVALEREHREIDGGLGAFTRGATTGTPDDASLLRALAALRRHIYLEEAFLFPPLRDVGAAPADLVSTCTGLLDLLDRHNSTEEPIIYPQADATLDAEATASLQGFIASGTLPEGRVCARAGEGGSHAHA